MEKSAERQFVEPTKAERAAAIKRVEEICHLIGRLHGISTLEILRQGRDREDR
jgi:hypothetical protein